MTELQKILEETVKNEIHAGNYQGEFSIEEFSGIPRFEASTHMIEGSITQKYNPEYEEQYPGKSKVVIRDVTRHEINHHQYKGCIGCPQTLEKHVDFFHEPMFEVLSEKGFSGEDVTYATNALQDTLLHLDLNYNGAFSLDGVNAFFEEIGNTSKKNNKKKSKFTRFYEAHVKLNMYLWGNKQQKKAIQKFYTHDEKVKEVIENFLERLGISNKNGSIKVYNRYHEKRDIEGNLIERVDRKDEEIQIKDRESIRDYFLNESNWKEISTVYAEEFSKLMDPSYAMPLLNHSGKGTKGRESKIKGKSEENQDIKKESPIDSDEGNVFDKKMKGKEFRKSRVKRANNLDENFPNWIDNYEAMNLLYESLAQELKIKSETFTVGQEMPIAWYGRRKFDPEKDNLKHIDFGFDENAKFGIRKKRFHEDIPLQVKTKPKGFPRMRFGILDTSKSMSWDIYGGSNTGSTKRIPWGDKSKYHYALLGFYGFLEYLKANHLLKQNSIDLANFSKVTSLGKGLAEAKRVALTPQFEGTVLDKDKISYFFEGRDNLIFTISDGEIENWSSIKDDFINNAKNHQYFHIQIGQENETTMDLRNAGLRVEPVMGEEDLAGRVIDLTDNLFRGKSK